MTMMMKRWIAISLFSTVSLATAACKQGEGERCQVTADCEDGLVCSQAEPKTCGNSANDQPLDAPLPILPEAGTADAAVDAMPDAP